VYIKRSERTRTCRPRYLTVTSSAPLYYIADRLRPVWSPDYSRSAAAASASHWGSRAPCYATTQ